MVVNIIMLLIPPLQDARDASPVCMLFYKKQMEQRNKLAIASKMKMELLPSKFQPKTEKQGSTEVKVFLLVN